MSSLLGLLRLGYGGVQAQRALVEVAGQNIANAATPGYRRQSAILATMPGANAGGVRVAGFHQARDAFLAREIASSKSTLGYEQSLRQTLETAAPHFDELEGQGLQSALDELFGSVSRLSQDPGNLAAREQVLAAGRMLATRIRQGATALDSARTAAEAELSATLDGANGELARVATLNREIAVREGSGGNAAALRDERDRLVESLSETLGVNAVAAADGSVTLVTGGGETLVQGDVAGTLSLQTPAGGDRRTLHVAHGRQAPGPVAPPMGGRVGGLLEARDVVAASALEALDEFAFEFTQAFNAIHASGVGADGVAGRDFFTQPAAVAGAAAGMNLALTDATQVAAAQTPGDLPGGNGIALQLQALARSDTFGGVPGTPADLLARAGNLVARRIADARAGEEAEGVVLAQVESLAASRTGVSVEEELVNVTAAQRALEASARTVQAADEMMEAVLRMV